MTPSSRFALELDASSQRPVGRITDGDGRTVEFDGWIGLAAAIETVHPAVGGERSGAQTLAPDATRGAGVGGA
jgi:hypothetical protein